MHEVKLMSPVSLRSCLSILGDSPLHQNIILVCQDISLRSNKLLLALAFPLLEHILQEDQDSGDDIMFIMPQFNGQEIKEVIKALFSQEIGIGEEGKAKDKNTEKDDQLCVDKKKGKDRETLGEVRIKKDNVNIYSIDLDEKGDDTNYGIYKKENITERCIEIPIDKSVESLYYEPKQAIEEIKPQSCQPLLSEGKIQSETCEIGDNEDLLDKKFELKCICGKQFDSKIKLKKHINRFSEAKRRERKKSSKIRLQINIFEYEGDVLHKQLYFKCKCGVQITSNKKLQIHMKNFHPVNGFKCKCGIEFSRKKNWKFHIKRSHIYNGPEEIYFKTRFPNARLEMPLPNTCYHCNATFESNIQMIEHKNIYINGEFWVCTVVGCQRKYRKSGRSQISFQLRSHLRKHGKEFIRSDEKSEDEDTSNDTLKKNLMKINDHHSEDKNMVAEWEHNTQQRVDPMIENIEENMLENNLRKESEKFINCKCGKIYSITSTFKRAKYNLKGHIIRRHGKSGPEMIHFKTAFPFEFKCYFCSELFEKKTHMIEHKKIYENGDHWVCPKPNCTTTYKKSSGSTCSSMLLGHLKQHRGEFDYSCDVCGKKFTNKAIFNLHQKVHVEKHLKLEICQICSKTLSDISGLRAHMSIKHGEAKFQCGQCNKQFKMKVSLKNHHAVHSDVRPFKCNFCNQSFKKKTTMKNHIHIIHIDTKKYTCNLCGKGFITLGQLKRHEGLHTGYKPFFCSYCEKSFIQKCNMKLHAEKCSSRPN